MSMRFSDSSLRQIEIANKTPISGYLDFPLLSLEETLVDVNTFIPSLTKTLSQARDLCNKTSKLVTSDESAAIYLYTMQTKFFEQLNTALREENRQALKPWFRFIRLLMSALEKLPSLSDTVWRGVNIDIGSSYSESQELTWWSFNSCSRFPNVVEGYIGNKGTLFAIECKNGKDISEFSAISDEAEVILMPGTRLYIKSHPLTTNNLRIFHIIENERERKSELKMEQYRNNTIMFFYNYDLLNNKNNANLIFNELKQNQTWKVLCLSFNKNLDTSYLPNALINQSTLKELDLNGVSIDDKGVVALADALTNNRCLTILRLSYNSIGNRGASALAEMLRRNKFLEKLFLTKNQIEDDGCISLCDSLRRNSGLLSLYLDNNSITQNSLNSIVYMLEHNLTLMLLVLGTNPITMDIYRCRYIIQATKTNDTCKVEFF